MNDTAERLDDVVRLKTPINVNLLKFFAMAIMLIDHIGAFLVQSDDPVYRPLRTIGRLAFPIFCYSGCSASGYSGRSFLFPVRLFFLRQILGRVVVDIVHPLGIAENVFQRAVKVLHA